MDVKKISHVGHNHHREIIITTNASIVFGVFGMIEISGLFPSKDLLNQFFQSGHDACDQDSRMDPWKPFVLSDEEYLIVKKWWLTIHPAAQENGLSANSWGEWVQKMLDQ